MKTIEVGGDIVEWIKRERDVWRELGTGCWIFNEFLLRNGQLWKPQPLPSRFKVRVPKACYWNAYQVVRGSRGRYRYVEGICCTQDMPLLIHHAWAVSPDDRVIDPTLQHWKTGESRSGGSQYFGIAWPSSMLPRGGGSIMDGPTGYDLEKWLELDPGFEKFIRIARSEMAQKQANRAPA